MPPLSPEARSARARLAALKRHRGSDADVTDEADQLEQARLDRHLDELAASGPAPSDWTPEQRDKLKRLAAPLFKAAAAGEGGASG